MLKASDFPPPQGLIESARTFSRDTHYAYLPASVLLAHAAAHAHLLLHRRRSPLWHRVVWLAAIAAGWCVLVGVPLMALCVLVLPAHSDVLRAAVLVSLVLAAGVSLCTTWAYQRKQGYLWSTDEREWIHVVRRRLVRQVDTVSGLCKRASRQTTLSLDDIVLRGHAAPHWSNDYRIEAFSVSLVLRVPRSELTDPPEWVQVLPLRHVGFDTPEEAEAFGERLSTLWHIPFQSDYGSDQAV